MPKCRFCGNRVVRENEGPHGYWVHKSSADQFAYKRDEEGEFILDVDGNRIIDHYAQVNRRWRRMAR